MTYRESEELSSLGYTVLRNVVSEPWLITLSNLIDLSFEQRNSKIALHALVDGNIIYINFLKYLIDIGFINDLEINYFESKCILNSFSVLDNIEPNFSSKIHRDLRFHSGNFPIMLNCLVMVDEFTKENGGTYILPKSHFMKVQPTDEYFYKNACQITGKPGDILLFNSNMWHASAINQTGKSRRAIPITLSKSCMKQLLDYPRALENRGYNISSSDLYQLLGYYSRVPASLEEWNQEDRTYKKDQD